MTSLSLKSRPGPSSYERTIMSVSYHMELFIKFITTIRLSFREKVSKRTKVKQTKAQKTGGHQFNIFFFKYYRNFKAILIPASVHYETKTASDPATQCNLFSKYF